MKFESQSFQPHADRKLRIVFFLSQQKQCCSGFVTTEVARDLFSKIKEQPPQIPQQTAPYSSTDAIQVSGSLEMPSWDEKADIYTLFQAEIITLGLHTFATVKISGLDKSK